MTAVDIVDARNVWHTIIYSVHKDRQIELNISFQQLQTAAVL